MAEQFRYTSFIDAQGGAFLRPIIDINLILAQRYVAATALLDTGADVSVLPYSLGLELGANWDEAKPVAGLSGNLSHSETRAIVLIATISTFNPIRMLFIWVKAEIPRVVLGRMNFFQEFDVCFFASADYFEIQRRT